MIRLLYLLIGFTFVLPLKAQDLGRLFTTPEQRHRIDQMPGRESELATPRQPMLRSVYLRGRVSRGESTLSAWINGHWYRDARRLERHLPAVRELEPGQCLRLHGAPGSAQVQRLHCAARRQAPAPEAPDAAGR